LTSLIGRYYNDQHLLIVDVKPPTLPVRHPETATLVGSHALPFARKRP
jgi:hypothetical protein